MHDGQVHLAENELWVRVAIGPIAPFGESAGPFGAFRAVVADASG